MTSSDLPAKPGKAPEVAAQALCLLVEKDQAWVSYAVFFVVVVHKLWRSHDRRFWLETIVFLRDTIVEHLLLIFGQSLAIYLTLLFPEIPLLSPNYQGETCLPGLRPPPIFGRSRCSVSAQKVPNWRGCVGRGASQRQVRALREGHFRPAVSGRQNPFLAGRCSDTGPVGIHYTPSSPDARSWPATRRN